MTPKYALVGDVVRPMPPPRVVTRVGYPLDLEEAAKQLGPEALVQAVTAAMRSVIPDYRLEAADRRCVSFRSVSAHRVGDVVRLGGDAFRKFVNSTDAEALVLRGILRRYVEVNGWGGDSRTAHMADAGDLVGRDFCVLDRLTRMVGERYAASWSRGGYGDDDEYEPGGLADQRFLTIYVVHRSGDRTMMPMPGRRERRNGPSDDFLWLLADDCEVIKRRERPVLRCPACKKKRTYDKNTAEMYECAACGKVWYARRSGR